MPKLPGSGAGRSPSHFRGWAHFREIQRPNQGVLPEARNQKAFAYLHERNLGTIREVIAKPAGKEHIGHSLRPCDSGQATNNRFWLLECFGKMGYEKFSILKLYILFYDSMI